MVNTKPNKGLSVVICCFNSASRLPETLRHLYLQIVPPNISWEIIIINNASSDNTVQVAETEWKKYNLSQVPFKIIDQPIPGLSYARQKGIEEASYDYLLFCDDDNWLNVIYISTAFEVMEADSTIGVLGGCGIFEPEQPVNPQIIDHSEFYVNGPQNWVDKDHWVYGASAIYRRSILIKLIINGWEQITTGRIGTKLIAGEDVEICFMFYLLGYKIQYDERLKFQHFVPTKRQSLAYIQTLSFWLSYSNVLLFSYNTIINKSQHPLKNMLNEWFRNTAKAVRRQIIQIIVYKIRTGLNPTLQQKIDLQSNLGTFCSIFRNKRKLIQHNVYIKQLLLESLPTIVAL